MEITRKSIHMGAILLALLFRFSWFQDWMAMAIAVLGFLFNLVLMPRVGRRLLRVEEGSPGPGMLCYPLGVLLAVVLFWRLGGAPHVAAAAWSLLAVGDGLSNLMGRSFGRHPMPWNPKKTYVGYAAFVLGGTFSVAFLLWFVSPRAGAGVPWSQAYLIGLVSAVAAGAVETLPWRIDDNLSVPLLGGTVIYLFDAVELRLVGGAFANPWKVLAFALVAGALVAAAYHKRLIELSMAFAGWLLGFLMLVFGGISGFVLLAGIYAAEELLARLPIRGKESAAKATRPTAAYEVWNAIATFGPAVFLAFFAAATRHPLPFQIAMVAALATAFADAAAAELGRRYGGSPFRLPSFERVVAGTPGAVSLGGTVFGILAGLLVAVIAAMLRLLPSPVHIGMVTLAAFIGIMGESLFGPALTRRGHTPHTLNFLCTLLGAITAMVLYRVF